LESIAAAYIATLGPKRRKGTAPGLDPTMAGGRLARLLLRGWLDQTVWAVLHTGV
jgi:hypothetical protein